MNILIVTTHLPYPPASGGAIRVHGIVEGLRRAGHDVTLLCFHDDGSREDVGRGVLPGRPYGDNGDNLRVETVSPMPTRSKGERLRDLVMSRQPDIAGRFYSEAFAARLRHLLAEKHYDLIQFEGIESVCYLPIAKQAQPTAKLVFDTFNAEYALQRNIYEIDRRSIKRLPMALYSLIQVGRIERYEGDMCRMADAVIAVSQEDANLLERFRPDGRIHIVPNGIWTERYAGVSRTRHAVSLPEHSIVFTGKMDYRPNVDAMLWFTEEILPRIREQVPDVQLTIVGQQPHARLDHLRSMPGVHLTGWVESVQPYLHDASVYIAPLRMGSGTRLKLLEAMASACAIVATSTASAGLRPEARQAMHIVDDPAAMAQCIVELLHDPEAQQQMGDMAWERVRQYYDWSALIPLLLDAYKDIGLG